MNSGTCRGQARRAFTLIELLVVVSIIAILTAILLPSLRLAHESGTMTVCASNLDQIYRGAFIHASENQDRIPYFAGWGWNRPGGEWWPAQVAQAMGQFEAGIYSCPGDSRPDRWKIWFFGNTITSSDPWSPYSTSGKPRKGPVIKYRSALLPVTYQGSCDLVEDTAYGVYKARKMSSWKRPSEALMMVEAYTRQSGTGCFRLTSDLAILAHRPPYGTRHPNQEDFERHLGQANFLFIDGHIGRLLPLDAGRLANNQEHSLP